MAKDIGRLAGKTALVTGGAKRLGRAISIALAGEGADLLVHYRNSADAAADTASEIQQLGRRAWTLQADLADPDEVERLMPRAVETAGSVNILINSASIFPKDRLTQVAPAEIERSVRLHAIAPLVLTRALAGRKAHVVNLLDSRVTDYDREHAAYHLGKRMLLSMTRMLALELAPEVAVNGVAPGLILPPEGEDEQYLQRLANTNPMNRHGDARDIADAVLYLVTSTFVTGQVIYVDGGRHMRGRVHG